jgi:hypothetical protein
MLDAQLEGPSFVVYFFIVWLILVGSFNGRDCDCICVFVQMQRVHVSFQASLLPAQHSNVLMVLPNTAKKGVPEMSHDP